MRGQAVRLYTFCIIDSSLLGVTIITAYSLTTSEMFFDDEKDPLEEDMDNEMEGMSEDEEGSDDEDEEDEDEI